MATTLRELIAKVVFRADPTQLKDFDSRLDAAKTKLLGLDAQARKVVRPRLDGSPLTGFIAKLRAVGAELKAMPGRAAAAFQKLRTPAAGPKSAGGDQPGGFGGLGAAGHLVAGLGAAAAAYKALNWGKGVLAEADAIGKLSAQLGIATDDLQTWSAFAAQAGASDEYLSVSVKALAKNIETAASAASGPAADAFKRLGISTAGWSKTMPKTMDVLLAAGGALGEMTSEAERLAIAQQLLGEGGTKLLPGFKDGTKAAKEQLDKLRDLAIVYDKDFIKSAEAANDEMDLFQRQMKGVGAQVMVAVLPSIRDLVRWITPVVTGVRDIVKHSNILTASFGALGVVGANKLLGMFGKLITRMGGFTNLLKAGGRIVARFVLPMLVLDDIISFLKGDQSVIGDILDAMFGAGAATKTLEGLKQAWEGISGGVKYFWGLMKGDQAAIDEGESKILKFGGFMDDLFAGLGKKLSEWGGMFAEAGHFAVRDLTATFEGWGNDLAAWFAGLWTRIVDGLGQFLSDAAGKVKGFAANLPLIGGLFGEDAPAAPGAQLAQNAQNGLALGGAPAVPGAKGTTVTLTDNSTITTNLNGVDAQNVGPALRQTERNISAELKRNKAQVLRQTVGAAGA